MKRSLFRIWRVNRLMDQVMRQSPSPKAPDELRDRLIEQAKLAEAKSSMTVAQPMRKYVWLATATALALVFNVVWQMLPHHVPEQRPRNILLVPPRRMVDEAKTPPVAPQQQPPVAPRRSIGPELVWHPRRPKLRYRRHASPMLVAEQRTIQAPGIRVSVTRETRPSIGYARVVAYSTDESGQTVRTAWILEQDSRTGASRQEMIESDDSGQRQLLTVAVARPTIERNGDEL